MPRKPKTIAEGLAAKAAVKPAKSSRAAASGSEINGVKSAAKTGGFNLRAVADVLAAEGLDPTIEIIKILNEQRPRTYRNGTPVLDENGEPITEPALDSDTRARVLLELQQYVHPKLKAVEIKMTGPVLSDEQIDARLQHLLSKEAK